MKTKESERKFLPISDTMYFAETFEFHSKKETNLDINLEYRDYIMSIKRMLMEKHSSHYKNRIDSTLEKAIIIIAILPLYMVVLNYLEISGWRHDALSYITSYNEKLQTEGRWINYLLFDYLKLMPNHLSGILQLVCIAFFSYQISIQATDNKLLSILISILSASIPTNVNLMLWPITSIIAFIYLACTPYLNNRLNPYIFFTLSGIVLFGTMSNYYFLLPLLFLGKKSEPTNGKLKNKITNFTLKVFCPWIFGFIIGYMVSNIAVYIKYGIGIQLADWRQPNPVKDINSLIDNAIITITYLKAHIISIKMVVGDFLWYAVAFIFILTIKQRKIIDLIIALLVIFSLYAANLSYGLVVQERTAITLWLGFITLFFIYKQKYKIEFRLIVTTIIIITFSFSYSGYKKIKSFNTIMAYHIDEAKNIISRNPANYRGVILVGKDETISKINHNVLRNTGILAQRGIESLDAIARIAPAFHELGYSTVIICQPENNYNLCNSAREIAANNDSNNKNTYNLKGVHQQGYLVIDIKYTGF